MRWLMPAGAARRATSLVVAGLVTAASGAYPQQPPANETLASRVLAAPELPWTGAHPPTHGLHLALIVLRATTWDPQAVLAAAGDMAPLLAQCGVRVGVTLQLLDAPPRFSYYRTPVARELARLVPTPRPAIYFVEDTLNRPAFDAEAIGRANSSGRPELADTVWVAAGTRDLPVALAHELVHVLMDSGAHSDEPGNLMRTDTTPEHTRLTDAQCAQMRGTGERNGLLTRLPG